MKSADSRRDVEVESINCPVCGADVACKVSYSAAQGRRVLTSFECEREGRCGIPAWDPCPLYVRFLEDQAHP